MREAKVHRIPTRSPDDVSGVMAAIEAGQIDPAGIVAILGKTEGNGCVNDFTRAFAVSALKAALGQHLNMSRVEEIAYVMSGGTEGALSPHLLVFERADGVEAAGRSLAIGSALTALLPADGLGRMSQVRMVAVGVAEAMASAGITDPADVHFVQIKVPLLTSEKIAAMDSEGRTVSTRDTLKSMGMSRGAAALGVGVALGEVDIAKLGDAAIGRDTSLWSSRASTSAGIEIDNHEIVVLGMSDSWSGPLAVDHAVMQDAIDTSSVRLALGRLGIADDPSRLVALLAKAEPGTSGRLRGARHTMLDDSDISATRHARAFVGGVLAGLVGSSEIFVSGGAEHQGPDGGGPVALIAKRHNGVSP
jgi:cyanuric acid amidohydrolase